MFTSFFNFLFTTIPRDFLLILLVATLSISVFLVLFGTVITIMKAKKSKNYSKLKYRLVAVLCLGIAAISWFANFGWLRLIMTITAIPFIHAIIFLLVSFYTSSQTEKSCTLKRITILSYITYLFGYVFLPDGGDTPPMYVFFGLFHNEIIIDLFQVISAVGLLSNIVFLVLQLIIFIKIKRKVSLNATE